jgi:pseudouridine-5'-phosphate glycosidase
MQAGRPVVALASAPLAHTLPWPANLEILHEIEAAAREEGAQLAVIGVWRGRLTVGLEPGPLEALVKGGSILRASRRDLPAVVVRGGSAATTVSASMYLACRAGLRLLVTGAIGGASRQSGDEEEPVWDISADLVELSNTPMAVVTAGARSVHHLAYTAEVLETFRVPVIGYATDHFPTFYMRAGTYPVPIRANTPAEVAAMLNAHWGMDGNGVVVAQLTPAEAALSPDELLPALQMVEKQAVEDRIVRQYLSPFLMDRLNRLTRGKALAAYQAILVENTRLAARIAAAL